MSFDFRRDSKKDSGVVRKTAINTPQRPGSLDVKALQVDVFPYDAFEFDDPDKTANPRVKLRDPWVWEVESEINALDQEVTTNAVKLAISTTSVVYNRSLIPTPTNLLLEGLHDDGSAYAGRFKIVLIYDEDSEITAYTSSADEATKSYAIPVTVEVAGTVYRVNNIVCNIYASGGTSKLLDTKSCSLNLNSTSTYYWGALTAAPLSDFILGDYYFDSNTSASGGGILRYWTGSAWAEMTSAHPMYIQAVWQALADMGAWATEQDEVIAAASAIFERLVTANAFIANLFAQQITVPDGGRIRYETGAGGQKRCVQLADEKIDWLDTPDTTPATPEQLRARIGRLGVGGAILMDGEFLAPVESNSQGGTTFDLNASAFFDSAYEGDSGFRVLYKDATTSYTMEATLSKTGVLGTPALVRDLPCTDACYVRLPDGRLSIWLATQDTLVNPIYSIGYRVYNSGGGLGAYYVFSSYGSLTEKAGSISALPLSSGQVIVIAASTDTSSGNKYLKALYTDTLWIEGGFNPVSEEIIDYEPSAGFGFNKSGVFERYDGLLQVFYKGHTSTIKSVFSNETIGGALTFGDAFTISGISAGDYGITVESVLGKAVVVFERWLYGVYQAEISLDGLTAQNTSLVFPGEATFRSKPRIHNDDGESYIVHCKTSLLKGYIVSKSRYARVGAGIIESGYVSGRGWYVKFGDGTMMQSIDQVFTASWTLWHGWYISQAIMNFPVPFYAVHGAAYSADNGADHTFTSVYKVTVSQLLGYYGRNDEVPPTPLFSLRGFAMGRWKA